MKHIVPHSRKMGPFKGSFRDLTTQKVKEKKDSGLHGHIRGGMGTMVY